MRNYIHDKILNKNEDPILHTDNFIPILNHIFKLFCLFYRRKSEEKDKNVRFFLDK